MPERKDNMSDLEQLKMQARGFVQERDWEQFQTPKNLAMALAGETGELIAEFQWLTAEESSSISGAKLIAVGEEMADVLIYLIRLADTLNIDLVAAAQAKHIKNVEKYPADRVRGSARKYTEYGDAD